MRRLGRLKAQIGIFRWPPLFIRKGRLKISTFPVTFKKASLLRGNDAVWADLRLCQDRRPSENFSGCLWIFRPLWRLSETRSLSCARAGEGWGVVSAETVFADRYALCTRPGLPPQAEETD
ncbi:hypothetical protein HMPREF9120_02205 [Neisseria sp. oral taxon 020 str. F0370]|nr:hypothetical protein HMPREF9120_02205 [Neisseria sp. oral taxon 020 str. F0370]